MEKELTIKGQKATLNLWDLGGIFFLSFCYHCIGFQVQKNLRQCFH